MDDPNTLADTQFLLCFNVYSLHRSFGRFYQSAFSETGLTYPKVLILMALERHGPLSISALSSRIGVEPHTVSPIVKKLAGFGAITRERSEVDERRVELAITAKGQEVLDRARTVIEEGFAALGLEPDRMMEAMRFLDQAREAVEKADPPKLSFEGLE
ncbi:MAG: MarR family transcriptional regulator [Devosiaceae bacterium]|nr:MarR family transcriptional regulator [Devosiaceae bacterium MH13]